MEIISNIVTRLMQSRNVVHLAHFKTKSYSQHMALDEYYKDIVEIFDRLVETVQGEYKQELKIRVPASPEQEDVIKYLEGLANYIEKNYNNLKSYQISIIDDGLELIYKTIYKLHFLK